MGAKTRGANFLAWGSTQQFLRGHQLVRSVFLVLAFFWLEKISRGRIFKHNTVSVVPVFTSLEASHCDSPKDSSDFSSFNYSLALALLPHSRSPQFFMGPLGGSRLAPEQTRQHVCWRLTFFQSGFSCWCPLPWPHGLCRDAFSSAHVSSKGLRWMDVYGVGVGTIPRQTGCSPFLISAAPPTYPIILVMSRALMQIQFCLTSWHTFTGKSKPKW